MIYRVIVRDGRSEVARGEHDIWDANDGAAVLSAARAVCNARNRRLPDAGRITLKEQRGRRWVYVRELTI